MDPIAPTVRKVRTRPVRNPKLHVVSLGALRSRTAMEDARDAGLLEGEKIDLVSFQVPRALLEAAQRESGIASSSDLALTALAILAQRDPVTEYLRKFRGTLGPDHKLDY